MEVEIVPKAVTKDEGVGAIGLLGGKKGAEAVELVGGNGEADHHLDLRRSVVDQNGWRDGWRVLTDDINGVGWTCQAFGVILDDISGFKDALDGAGFDVELVVAEAILSAGHVSIGIRHEVTASWDPSTSPLAKSSNQSLPRSPNPF